MLEPKATKAYTMEQDAEAWLLQLVLAEVKFREETGRRKPAGFVTDAVFYQNPTTWLKGKN